MSDFVCSHQKTMAWCKLHDCDTCGYKGRESDCPFSRNMAGDTMPTFREAIAAYRKSASVEEITKDGVERYVVKSLTVVGLTLDDKLSAMSYGKFELLVERLSDPNRERGSMRPISIGSVIGCFRSISNPSVDYVKYLRSISRDPYSFSIPNFTFKKPPKQTVSIAQARKVIVAMERLFASGRESDLSVALLIYFAIFMQMRVGDICLLKWGDIKMTPTGIMLVYVPHKTQKTSPDPVSIHLSPMEYEMIRPYIKGPDDWVIPRYPNKTGRNTRRKGLYVGFHRSIRRRANVICKDAGIGLEFPQQKKVHALRKFRETMVATLEGIHEAARRSHHSEAVAKKYYIGSEYSLVVDSAA